MSINNDSYLTTIEVGEIVDLTPDYVRKLIARGKLKATKLGHNWLVKPKDLKNIKRVRKSKEKE